MRLAFLTLLAILSAGSALAQSYPAPPQTPATSNGVEPNDTVRIPSGASGFVDPSPWGYCRYVTNGDSREVAIPISQAVEWQYFRYGKNADPVTPTGVTEVVCCRPATTTLCQGATGGTVTAPVNGSGVNGYGVLAATGTATATCSDPPYGTYQDTRTFVCGQTGSGVDADGQWSQSGGDTNSCTPNSYVTYGGCSAGCGGGNLYEVIYNSCGQVTAQGYFGPSCNTQSCCTPTGTSCGGCSGGCGGGWGAQTCSNGCSSWTQSCQNMSSCGPVVLGQAGCSPYAQSTDCIAGTTWETCGTPGYPPNYGVCNANGSTWWFLGAANASGCSAGTFVSTGCVPEPNGSCANTAFQCVQY